MFKFSSDPRIQREQYFKAHANPGSLNVSGLSQEQILQKKEKEEEDLLEFLTAMEMAERMFAEATRTANEAMDNLIRTIDHSRDELTWQREAFEQNTVTLSDGSKVYYDTDTRQFAEQDEHGQWHALQDEDRITEAYRKAAENDGLASTKLGKEALDRWEAAIDNGNTYADIQHKKLDQIDQAVENGSITLEDASEQKKAITDDVKAFKKQFEQDGMEFRDRLAPTVLQEQERYRQVSRNQLQDSHDRLNVTNRGDDLFGNSGNSTATNLDDTTFEATDGISEAFASAHDNETVKEPPETMTPSQQEQVHKITRTV